MKRIISKILVTIITISSVMPVVNERKAYAATVSLIDELSRNLSVGERDDVPLASNLEGKEEEAFLRWDFSSFDSGFYELTYPLRDNKFVTFSVNKKNPNAAVVNYQVFNSTLDQSSFRVYSSNEALYKNYDDYRDLYAFSPGYDPYRSSNSNIEPVDYYVTITPTIAEDPTFGTVQGSQFGLKPATPEFGIIPGTGFSFQYDNSTVHFLWDQTTNDFYINTNDMKLGNIYPFTLKVADTNSLLATAAKTTTNVFTGLKKPLITPYANNGIRAYSRTGNILDIIDMSGELGNRPKPDEHPGSKELELEFEFEQ
jgi:hypothetical protein